MPAATERLVGALTERLTILTATPVALTVSSITRASTTATVTTSIAHGFTTGDYVRHAGATQTEYNVEAQVTVTGTTTYTFTVSGNPATPATGTSITATYRSDASGGQQGEAEAGFSTLATVWGSMTPLTAVELLQARAIGSEQTYMGRIYYRSDVTPSMRISWRPYGYSTAKTLEIHGVQPDPVEPRRYLMLNVGEIV